MKDINLNCRLCLRDLNNTKQLPISLFENNLIQENISAILFKHLWFLNIENDCYSKVICEQCWTTIKEFHIFYKQIQHTQNQLFFINKNQPNQNAYTKENNKIKLKTKRIYDLDAGSDYNDESHLKEEFNDDEIIKNNEEISLDDDFTEKHFIKEKMINQITTINLKQKIVDENAQIKDHFNMECSVCGHLFNDYSNVRTHFQEKHKQRGYLLCCGTKFFIRCLMIDHILLHSNPELFKCTNCDRTYANRYLYTNHMKEHDPNIKRLQCDKCSKGFVKKSDLVYHKRMRHYTEEDKKFICDICNKKFLTKRSLQRHMDCMHPTKKPVPEMICDICAKEFKSKVSLESHRLDHFNVDRPRLQCKVCENWFRTKDSLRVHLNRHRSSPIACSYCGKLMNNHSALDSHVRAVHCERNKKCTMCEKAFKSDKSLREHIASHTGHDLYTCTYCTKTFKSNGNMHTHRKNAHPLDWERDRGKRITMIKFNKINDVQKKNNKKIK